MSHNNITSPALPLPRDWAAPAGGSKPMPTGEFLGFLMKQTKLIRRYPASA